jgi:hypothetical protein
MSPRLSIVLGFTAGILAAALVLGGIFAFAPIPGSEPGPSTPVAAASDAPPSAAASSSSPDASPTADASSLLPSGLLGVGGPAPSLVVPQVGGGTIDLSALRGGPCCVLWNSNPRTPKGCAC